MVISRTDISRNDVDSLNAAIDRIRKVIPDQPYIQTIPQDGARWDHHYRESARVWRGQVPFGREERPDLQYQTFYYHEHGTDLIHLRVHSPPPGPPQDKTPAPEATPGSTATPKHGPKKKISLADYKNHKTKGTGGEETGRPIQVNGGLDELREHTPKASKQEKVVTQTRDFAADKQGPSSLKRKRSTDRTNSARSPREFHTDLKSQPRASPEPARMERGGRSRSPTASRKRKGEHGKNGSMPLPTPLSPLQPLIPGRLSPLGNLLPDMLSPNLPPDIVAELDRRARLRTTSDAPKASADTSQPAVNKNNSDVPNDVRTSRDKRAEEKPVANGQPVRTRDPTKPQLDSKRVEDTKDVNTSSLTDGHTEAELKDPLKLVVKFKIPKRLRLDYRRLLQFQPRPHKPPQEKETNRSPPSQTHNFSDAKAFVVGTWAGAKSTRPNDNTPGNKRFKQSHSPPTCEHDTTAEHEGKIATPPLQAPFQSPPPPSRHHADKHTTPSSKKNTGASMARISSTDGHVPSSATATPASSSSLPTMPLANPKPSPSGAVSQATRESEAWSAESTRLLDIGKTLKSAAKEHEKTDKVLALLTNIESLCAFMISFHAGDMNSRTLKPPVPNPSVRRTWITLHAFWRFVWASAEKQPALRAAVGGLGLVYLAQICAWSAANNKEREKEGMEAVAMLSRIGSGPRIGVAAARKLWPETWKKCLADGEDGVSPGPSDDDHGRPGKYAGPLELPVGIQTPLLRAIRTTLAMLGEWKTKEGKPFQTTLKLG